MNLDDYEEPKGAYYTSALVADFPDAAGAEQAIAQLRDAGFTERDIQVARRHHEITVVVSEPTPGMLEEARRILAAGPATNIHPYGSGHPF